MKHAESYLKASLSADREVVQLPARCDETILSAISAAVAAEAALNGKTRLKTSQILPSRARTYRNSSVRM